MMVLGPVGRWAPALHPDEARALRAMRSRREVREWRAADLAKATGLPYGRAWRSLQRLHARGYVRRDLLARWTVRWERVLVQHRAEVLVEGPEEPWAPPAAWERVLAWVLARFGGEWVER